MILLVFLMKPNQAHFQHLVDVSEASPPHAPGSERKYVLMSPSFRIISYCHLVPRRSFAAFLTWRKRLEEPEDPCELSRVWLAWNHSSMTPELGIRSPRGSWPFGDNLLGTRQCILGMSCFKGKSECTGLFPPLPLHLVYKRRKMLQDDALEAKLRCRL